MAEAPPVEPVPCSSGVAVGEPEQAPPEAAAVAEDVSEDGASAAKKPRLERSPERLEQRLGGILCCAVCLDLPPAAVFQCTNGHLMCAACFTHVLADARLRDESATCPNCRVDISKTNSCRNLAVEKTVSELPSECKFCARVFPRHQVRHHQDNTCDDSGETTARRRRRKFKFSQIVVEPSGGCAGGGGLYRVLSALQRAAAWLGGSSGWVVSTHAVKRKLSDGPRLTECAFAVVGCPWRGPAHEAAAHAAACRAPTRSAADALSALKAREDKQQQHMQVYTHLLDLLSYEKITFNDLQLKPYRTEEFVHKLYYETSRFAAFGHQWVVKANVNRHQRDPTQSIQREITYQVILKSKVGVGSTTGSTSLGVQWVWVRGPFGEARVMPKIHTHQFSDETPEAVALPLPLTDPEDANRLLANKAIHFRLIMFLSSK